MNIQNPLLKSLGYKPRKGKIITCKVCGKEFYVKPFLAKTAKYCSIECHHKGIERGGKIECKCKVCGKIYITFRSHKRLRGSNYCSRKCQAKGRTLFYSGKNSANWKDGISSENHKLRNSKKWKKWRETIFKRDNFTCQTCGKQGVRLEPHHIKPFAYFPELRFDVSNGQTLCFSCHQKTKIGFKKLREKYVKRLAYGKEMKFAKVFKEIQF